MLRMTGTHLSQMPLNSMPALKPSAQSSSRSDVPLCACCSGLWGTSTPLKYCYFRGVDDPRLCRATSWRSILHQQQCYDLFTQLQPSTATTLLTNTEAARLGNYRKHGSGGKITSNSMWGEMKAGFLGELFRRWQDAACVSTWTILTHWCKMKISITGNVSV